MLILLHVQDMPQRGPGGDRWAPPNNPVDAQWWNSRLEEYQGMELSAEAIKKARGMAVTNPSETPLSAVCS